MAKTAYPTQSTSHIGRIRHRRNGAKPAKWATNAATKSPTVANTVERGIAPGRMRGERGAQDRTAGGTHRLPHAYSARVQRSERGRAAAGEGRRTAGQRGDLACHAVHAQAARRPVRITSRWIATIFPTTPPRSNAVRRFVICMSRTRYGRGLPTARWMVSSPIIPRPART